MSASAITQKLRSWQAGAVVMAVGAGLLGAGLLQTTSAASNDDCPSGKVLIAKFNFQGNDYVFEKPSGNQNVVTVTNDSEDGGNWTSQLPVTHIFVKAGFLEKTVSYTPAATSGTFNNDGLTWHGHRLDISHIEFCGNTAQVTTTTTVKPTTTTTLPPTTTTVKPTTTTTLPPTTTTTKPATTTTVHAAGSTSTTVKPTTTTLPTTTTTVKPTTSTTMPGAPSTTSTTFVIPPQEGPTSTTAASSTTTVGSAGATTTTQADATTTTTTSFSQTGDANASVTSTTIVKSAAADSGSLPRTGGQSVPLVVAGVTMLVAGLAITLLALKRRRTA